MDLEGALRARIVAAGTSAGSRVYWDERPQGSALPAVVLTMIDDSREQHLKGFQSVQRASVQLDFYGETKAVAKALKDATLAAVIPENTSNGIAFGRAIEDRAASGSERSGDKTVFRHRVDLGVWWSTA